MHLIPMTISFWVYAQVCSVLHSDKLIEFLGPQLANCKAYGMPPGGLPGYYSDR